MTIARPMQLFDALPAQIEDALRASIERFGIHQRITLTDADRQALAPLLGSSLPPELLAEIDAP